MKVPFERFIVTIRSEDPYGIFTVDVRPPFTSKLTKSEREGLDDARRRFIEDAIREKLDRERKD